MNKFKKLIKEKLINPIKGAGETVSNYYSAAKATGAAKKNVEGIVINKAKENYRKKNKREMTPSLLESEYRGGILHDTTKEYLSDKKKIRKEEYKKYKL